MSGNLAYPSHVPVRHMAPDQRTQSIHLTLFLPSFNHFAGTQYIYHPRHMTHDGQQVFFFSAPFCKGVITPEMASIIPGVFQIG